MKGLITIVIIAILTHWYLQWRQESHPEESPAVHHSWTAEEEPDLYD